MRRITTWLLSTISALVLLFSYHTSTDSGAAASVVAQSDTDTGTSPSTGSGSTDTPSTGSGQRHVDRTAARHPDSRSGVVLGREDLHR